MQTPIGRSLDGMPRLSAVAVGLAAVVVTADFWFSALRYPEWTRASLAAGALVLVLSLTGGDRGSLGLRLRPVQPVGYWVRATAVVAGLLLVPIMGFLALTWAMNWEYQIPVIAPAEAGSVFLHMCVFAPLVEETIYRLAICSPLAGTLGPTAAILVSGMTFAALHFVYGNPGPDNFLAGYVLAWAYLKSGSLAVPIVLHALGNAVAFAAQLGAWYAV